jgi:hypothetical protein
MEMNRRQILQSSLSAGGALFLSGHLHAQEAGSSIYVHPTGNDTNPGTKEKPIKTLAGAAQRINTGMGTGAVSIILSEGVYAVSEPAVVLPSTSNPWNHQYWN